MDVYVRASLWSSLSFFLSLSLYFISAMMALVSRIFFSAILSNYEMVFSIIICQHSQKTMNNNNWENVEIVVAVIIKGR